MLRQPKSALLLIFFIACGVMFLGCPPEPPRYIEEGKFSKSDKAPEGTRRTPVINESEEGEEGESGEPSGEAPPPASTFDKTKAKTPWANAKKGQWVIYAKDGSAAYYEVTQISGSKVKYQVYDGAAWHDLEEDMEQQNNLFISATTTNLIASETKEVMHPFTQVSRDMTETGGNLRCQQYVRKGLGDLKQQNWICDAVPFENGKVVSKTTQGGITGVNLFLLYYGTAPPDREGEKFKEWMKIAKDWRSKTAVVPRESGGETDLGEDEGRGIWDEGEEGDDTDESDDRWGE